MILSLLGSNGCESRDDATNVAAERPGQAAHVVDNTAPAIVVCHPEIAAVFIRLGASSDVLGADSDSARLDEMSHVLDFGPGCDRSDLLAQQPETTVILRLGEPSVKQAATNTTAVSPERWDLAPNGLDEIVDAIHRIGTLIDAGHRAQIETARITRAISSVAVRRDGLPRLTVAWIVDAEPMTAVGATGLLHEMLELAGAENAFHDLSAPLFLVTPESIRERSPDIVLVPAGDSHLAEALALPVREIANRVSVNPTLDPVGRIVALHEILYPATAVPAAHE